MSQTQLASMFLGNPQTEERDERLKGTSSSSSLIHILDGQEDVILDYIVPDDYWDDNYKKSLENTLETYEFVTFADKSFSQHLEKRNRILITDDDNNLIEFIPFEIIEDRILKEKRVFAIASYLDLKKASVIYPGVYEGSAGQHAGRFLNNTGWQVGLVEGQGTRKLEVENHTNPFEMLRRVAREFDLELHFRAEHDGRRITGRYVDLLERAGEWRGREVEFGKDLLGLERIEKQDIVTALLGLGPEDENGNRLEVLVEDGEALRRWGRVDEHGNLHHLIEPYEIHSDRLEMTEAEAIQYTRTALDKRINAQVTYVGQIADLENIPGLDNEKIRFGDTIRIKDTHYDPPLFLEARIFEIEGSNKEKSQKEFKLGDYIEYTEEEVHAIWMQLRNEIRKRVSVAQLEEYAEPKKIESDTPPEIKDGENPIWVDTSKTPKVAHVVVGGQWQKMTPTTPQEVNAYTKQQVDAKAAQALADAKAFSKNASNITEGVVDVGAIPLRTSVTGARLEWDGVNGLVQYDSRGNPVSWLDLEANAHFANAFLSGRVEALEGYFGKNKRVTIGDDGLTVRRPDGAIWMQDGMITSDYNISGFDPHFMDMGQIPGAGTSGRFPAFYFMNGFYQQDYGALDGRGTPSAPAEDIRDSELGYTVRFQRYEFVHTARYFVLDFRGAINANTANIRVRLQSGSQRLLQEDLPQSAGLVPLVVDLGVPTYQKREIDLRIGWLRNGGVWGNAESRAIFRINRVYQTDHI